MAVKENRACHHQRYVDCNDWDQNIAVPFRVNYLSRKDDKIGVTINWSAKCESRNFENIGDTTPNACH